MATEQWGSAKGTADKNAGPVLPKIDEAVQGTDSDSRGAEASAKLDGTSRLGDLTKVEREDMDKDTRTDASKAKFAEAKEKASREIEETEEKIKSTFAEAKEKLEK